MTDPARVDEDEPSASGLEGLNPDDPGVRMLGRELASVDPHELLLVHCGDLPGIRPGATRLILDVRERTGSPHHCIPDLQPGVTQPAVGEQRWSAAAVWPRAHLGKDFSEQCLALAALAVREGGRVLCAVRKQKGGKSLGRTLQALLGDEAVEVIERERGYHLWVGRRGATLDLDLAHELLERRYEYELGPQLEGWSGPAIRIASRPGVFSRRELDAGTRSLLHVAAAVAEHDEDVHPSSILDVCAGLGPLALWSARRWPNARVLAVESNLRAVALLRENAEQAGVGGRVHVLAHDGLPSAGEAASKELASFRGADLALINPPTHADPATLERLLDVRAWLRPGGRLLLVVNRPGRAVEILHRLGAQLRGGERDDHYVFEARWSL